MHRTKMREIRNPSFREKFIRNHINERIIIEINKRDIIINNGNFQFLSEWDFEKVEMRLYGWNLRELNRIQREHIMRRITASIQV